MKQTNRMLDYKLTPTEKKQVYRDSARDILEILKISIRRYKLNPTADLEKAIREVREEYEKIKIMYKL